jgi:hypothetical protein
LHGIPDGWQVHFLFLETTLAGFPIEFGVGGILKGVGGILTGVGGILKGVGGILKGVGGILKGVGGILKGVGSYVVPKVPLAWAEGIQGCFFVKILKFKPSKMASPAILEN